MPPGPPPHTPALECAHQRGDAGDQRLVEGGEEAAVPGAVAGQAGGDQAEPGETGEQPGRRPREGLDGAGGQGQVPMGGAVPALAGIVLVEGAEQQGQTGVTLADGVVAPMHRRRVGRLAGSGRHQPRDPIGVGDPGAHLRRHRQGRRRRRSVHKARATARAHGTARPSGPRGHWPALGCG